jgi:hypothetical protein
VSGNPALSFTTISNFIYGDGYDIVVSQSTSGSYWLVTGYGVWCYYCEGPPVTDNIYGFSATLYSGVEPSILPGCGGYCAPVGTMVETGFVASATPLPPTWLMLLTGFVGFGFLTYRGTIKRTAIASA